MAMKLYELRIFRSESADDVQSVPVPVSTFLAVLDLANQEQLAVLLERHLLAAADRVGARRREVHLFSLDVREVNERCAGVNKPLFRWTLPVGVDLDDLRRRWR